MSEELKPCPFCNGGETRIDETRLHRGVTTNPRPNPVVRAEVKHWCEPEEGQPHRRMITMTGRDRESAIKAWNTHSADTELAAERAKVKSLSEVIESQKQTHDALIKKVEDLQAQLEVAQVTKEATEDMQTVHMIGFHSRDDEVRGLKAQNAVLREALVKISTTAFQKYDGNKPFVSEHDSGYSLGIADGHRLAAKWAYEAIKQALSLTPSDAAEIVRKKDELVATLSYCLHKLVHYAHEERLNCFLINVVVPDVFINKCTKAIEAARAALEVDG